MTNLPSEILLLSVVLVKLEHSLELTYIQDPSTKFYKGAFFCLERVIKTFYIV